MKFDVTEHMTADNKGGGVIASIDFEWDTRKIKNWEQNFINGLYDMAWDIRNKALFKAPYVTGALRNSIRVERVDQEDGIDIIAGGKASVMDNADFTRGNPGTRFVDYAWKREQGPNKNPATEHYMENSLSEVMSGDWQQHYFKGVTQ